MVATEVAEAVAVELAVAIVVVVDGNVFSNVDIGI